MKDDFYGVLWEPIIPFLWPKKVTRNEKLCLISMGLPFPYN